MYEVTFVNHMTHRGLRVMNTLTYTPVLIQAKLSIIIHNQLHNLTNTLRIRRAF